MEAKIKPLKEISEREIMDKVKSYNQAVCLFEKAKIKEECEGVVLWLFNVAIYRKMLIECTINNIPAIVPGI